MVKKNPWPFDESHPVTLSPFAALRVNSAKGLSRSATRCFAALSMTGLALSMTGLSLEQELSSSLEPCLTCITGPYGGPDEFVNLHYMQTENALLQL